LFFLFFLCLSRGAEQHFLFFRRVFSKVGNSRLHSTQSDCGVRLSTVSCLPSKQAGKPRHAGPCHSATHPLELVCIKSKQRAQQGNPDLLEHASTHCPHHPSLNTLRSGTNVRFIRTCARASHYLMTYSAISYSKRKLYRNVTVSSDDHIISLGGSYLIIFSLRREGGVCRLFSKRWPIAGVFVVVAIDEK